MATIVLQAVGTAVGGFLAGPIGAAVGAAVGSIGGNFIDQQLFGGGGGNRDRVIEGPRLTNSQILSSEEGTSIPRIYGTAKVSGELIWATNFLERRHVTRQTNTTGGGGKGGGGSRGATTTVTQTTYTYHGNFAIALCEGSISHVRKIWADGTALDVTKFNIRIYKGSQSQLPDSLIVAKQGTNNAPAYRGLAYVVFEDFPLENYGNRIPQFSFEVIKSIAKVERDTRAITIIPGATEYGYDPNLVVDVHNKVKSNKLNRNVLRSSTDWTASMNELQGICPNLDHAAIVVPWFGNDLRCGNCQLRPKVEVSSRNNPKGQDWIVSGIYRNQAQVVSRINNRPSYGGTPNDASLIRGIKNMKQRGLKVIFYPFILMDIKSSYHLPNPLNPSQYQGSYPWRGLITSYPAAGQSGTPDKTQNIHAQINAFMGNAAPSHFQYQETASVQVPVSSEDNHYLTFGASSNYRYETRPAITINYNGPNEWSYRRQILHYAHLCKAAGGVDTFLIGSELRGLTTLRDNNNQFPFVNALKILAADVKSILGANTKVSYAADWSEYFGYHPQDGSDDLFFHLDPLWADPNIVAIGIDNYMPLSDWRESGDPSGSQAGRFAGDKNMLKSNIKGGEGYDWYYASAADREAGNRSEISDGLGKPWVFRYKDLWSWWSNYHYNRIGGVEQSSPTPWRPYMKQIWFTELGCPAIDKGANQPNVFYDPKSSQSAIPYFSLGYRDDYIQNRFIAAHQEFWSPSAPGFRNSNNPKSPSGVRMVDDKRIYLWTWDVRPYPVFPRDRRIWSDGPNWHLGHWLNGRFGGMPLFEAIAAILKAHGFYNYNVDDVEGFIDGYLIAEVSSARKTLENLIEIFQLIVYEDNGVLVFKSVGFDEAIHLSKDELVENKDDPLHTAIRAEENELPNAVTLNHVNPSIDYRRAVSSSRRIEGQSERIVQLDAPIVISETQAIPIIDRWLQTAWVGRERISFRLSNKYRNLQLGDEFYFENEDQRWRIKSMEFGADISIEAQAVETYTQAGIFIEPTEVTLLPVVGAGYAHVEFLDLPILFEDDVASASKVAAAIEPWRGALSLYSSPDGENYDFRQLVEQNATIGEIVGELQPSFYSRWDEATHIEVNLYRGSLSSIPKRQVFNGGNTAFIKSKSGHWEVVQFRNAELIGENRWKLSGLLRGQAGSDVEMLAGCDDGAAFVLFNEAVTPISYSTNEEGLSFIWRVVEADDAVNETNFGGQQFTLGHIGLRPYTPVHLRTKLQSNGGVAIDWIRRTRINGDSWSGLEVQLNEDSETYLVEIYDGSIKKREFETHLPNYTYAQADLTSDGFNVGSTIEFRVSQFSARYGFGASSQKSIQI